MATFKAEVQKHHKKSDGTYNIKIRVTHNQKKRYLATPFFITQSDLTRAYKKNLNTLKMLVRIWKGNIETFAINIQIS